MSATVIVLQGSEDDSDRCKEELSGNFRVVLSTADYLNAMAEIERVKPDYVICYDDIKEGDLKVAKNYNLPIVLIDTKKYNFKDGAPSVEEKDKYIM